MSFPVRDSVSVRTHSREEGLTSSFSGDAGEESPAYRVALKALDQGTSIRANSQACWDFLQGVSCEALADPDLRVFVEHLHQHGAFKGHSNEALSLLERACQQREEALIESLVKKRLNPRKRNHRGETALHILCRYGRLGAAKRLVAASEGSLIHPLNAISYRLHPIIHEEDHEGNTALHLAAQAEDPQELLEWLLAKGARVDQPNAKGRSPLHFAAEAGSPFGVLTLLSAGAKPLERDHDGRLPIHLALEGGEIACVQALVIDGRQVLDRSENQPSLLEQVMTLGRYDLLALFEGLGVNLMTPAMQGNQTPWDWAIENKEVEALRALLQCPSVEKVVSTDLKGLRRLLMEGNVEQLQLLADAGFSWKKVEFRGGMRPIHLSQSPEVSDFLLEQGCDLEAVDQEGLNALHWALEKGRRNLGLHLMARGLNPLKTNHRGFSPFFVLDPTQAKQWMETIGQASPEVLDAVCQKLTKVEEKWDELPRPLRMILSIGENGRGSKLLQGLKAKLDDLAARIPSGQQVSIVDFRCWQKTLEAVLQDLAKQAEVVEFLKNCPRWQGLLDSFWQSRAQAQRALMACSIKSDQAPIPWLERDIFLGILPHLYPDQPQLHKYKEGLLQSLYALGMDEGAEWGKWGLNVNLLDCLHEDSVEAADWLPMAKVSLAQVKKQCAIFKRLQIDALDIEDLDRRMAQAFEAKDPHGFQELEMKRHRLILEAALVDPSLQSELLDTFKRKALK